MRERELKPLKRLLLTGELSSLPMRERELKLFRVWQSAVSRQSLPMRERELKLFSPADDADLPRRSPCGSAN